MAYEKTQMSTLVFCLEHLKKEGFETSFKAMDNGLLSLSTKKMYQPEEVKVVHYYRFEGESNPDDNAVVYAIESNTKEKGILVNGYGISSDSQVDEFMKRVDGLHK